MNVPFKVHTRMVEGLGPRACYEVVCADCALVLPIPKPTLKKASDEEPMAARMIERAILAKGWEIGSRLKDPHCPACRQARIDRKKERTLKLVEPAPAVTPEPITTPTIELRRTVMAALEKAYDVEAGRYRRSGSDKALASHTGAPIELVSALREMFFGEGGGNEAHEETVQTLKDLRLSLDALDAKWAKAFEQLSDDLQAVRKRLADAERALA